MSMARDLDAQCALWIIRRENPEWSETDDRDLEAWLDQSMAHKAAYWRLDHGWRAADRIAAINPATPSTRLPDRSWLRLIKFAASILLLLAIGRQTAWLPVPEPVARAEFSTPVGGHRAVSLADGSRLELNTHTRVRSALSPSERQVWLDRGEVYFEVAHMAGRPFVIHAGMRTVTVLGTKFAVRRDQDKLVISVIEGRVRMATPEGDAENAPIITTGMTAIARGASTLLMSRSDTRVGAAVSWRQGMIVFNDTSLGEVAEEFNRYQSKPLRVPDPRVAAIRIGGAFQAKNVEAFLRLLHDAYGLRITEKADGVNISH